MHQCKYFSVLLNLLFYVLIFYNKFNGMNFFLNVIAILMKLENLEQFCVYQTLQTINVIGVIYFKLSLILYYQISLLTFLLREITYSFSKQVVVDNIRSCIWHMRCGVFNLEVYVLDNVFSLKTLKEEKLQLSS